MHAERGLLFITIYRYHSYPNLYFQKETNVILFSVQCSSYVFFPLILSTYCMSMSFGGTLFYFSTIHKCFAHQTPNAMIHTLLAHIFRPLQDLLYLAHSRIPASICEYGKLCKSCSIALEKSEICVTHY